MDELKSLVMCKICKKIFKNPIILPCGETICSEHILNQPHKHKSKESSLNTRVISCHFCKKEHILPLSDADLIVNKLAESLTHLIKVGHFTSISSPGSLKILEKSWDWSVNQSAWDN